MSDAAVMILVAGIVNIATMIVGFLTLWVKLRYGEKAVSDVTGKIDENTKITTRIENQTNGPWTDHLHQINQNTARIAVVEGRMDLLQAGVDHLAKDITSTRHEMRGHFQTVTNGIALINKGTPPSYPSNDPPVV